MNTPGPALQVLALEFAKSILHRPWNHQYADESCSSPDSVRFRHIRKRPHVSATHLPGEELAVTVHGRAVPIDIKTDPFRQALLEVYVPRYGPEWEHDFLDRGAMYARIEADRMFTFQMDPATLS